MRNMVLLIDTNVVLDVLQKRGILFDPSCRILELCANRQVQGYIAFHSISNLWYILRKSDDGTKREKLRDICNILTVCSVGHNDVVCAIENGSFKDLEDCLQDKCAQAVQADYIITRNLPDFSHSCVKAITPEGFLELCNETFE